jgi:hypothetical protein
LPNSKNLNKFFNNLGKDSMHYELYNRAETIKKDLKSDKTIDNLSRRLAKSQGDTKRLKEIIINMQNSKSWKITEPLRKIYNKTK